MKKKLSLFIFFILSILFILVLTGCWDRRELNQLGIVLATGLDKDLKTGEIILTAQIVRATALKEKGGGESPNEIVTSRGNTILQAIRNISKEFDRRAFFAHNKIIIIGEHFARDGILPILDFFKRGAEWRSLTKIVIARGTKPEMILGVEHGIEAVQATYLGEIIKRRKVNSEVTAVSIIDFVKKLIGAGINPIAGVMEIKENPVLAVEKKEENMMKGVKLSGTAVFKNDILIGFFNDKETRGLNWVIGEIESGIINVPSPAEKDKLLGLEIIRAKRSVTSEIKKGKIRFIIEVKEIGLLTEQHTTDDTSNPEVIDKLEMEQEKIIKKEIELAINKAQKEFESDIFGFGSVIARTYPDEWKKIEKTWPELFPVVEYEIKVVTKIEKAGLLLKPIEAKE